MNEKHTGRVCTVCPECGKRQWVEVIFPSFQERFEDTLLSIAKNAAQSWNSLTRINSMNTATLSTETGIQKRILVSFFFFVSFFK